MRVYAKPIDDNEWKLLKFICRMNKLTPCKLREFTHGIEIFKAMQN